MKITSKKRKAELDFDEIVKNLISQYGTIFFANIEDNFFIYKPLSRKDHKAIVENTELSDIEKEDEVCAMTILWPENIDLDEIEAGIPGKLYVEILKNSFLDSSESIAHLIDVYREELNTLDTQMSCIISEAFPNYDIEEIESWDMIKFCKIFSRAEWKLKNLRSLSDIKDVTEYLRGNITDEEEEYEQPSQPQQQQAPARSIPQQSNSNKIKVGSKEMTAEEYRQYQEMQKKFPEIDWGADAMFTGYSTETADTVPVALR